MKFKKMYIAIFLVFIMLFVILTYNLFFQSNRPNQKTYDRAKSEYLMGQLNQYLLDSKDILLENIYTADGRKFNFESHKSKWYELVEFLSQEVYTSDKKVYGPYFTVRTNANEVIEHLTPKAYVGYSIVILSDDYSKESPVSFVYTCETESENVIRIVYSEDEFLRITKENNDTIKSNRKNGKNELE